MEVEAKLRIPDENMFQRLLDATALAGFQFDECSVVELQDCYFDTNDRAIRSAGYAYRMRRQGENYMATLKGLGHASGGIHRRVELEASLSSPCPPRMWPPGPARDLALRLCESKLLVPLFEIDQIRHSCMALQQGRAVAQVSLDRASVRRDNDPVAAYLELEIELLPQGSERDLDRLVSGFQDVWGLEPEDRSKFERAWTALDLDGRESPGIGPDDPMSEAGRKTFFFHYRRMVDNEPGTRLGEDIEFLHDMRVATRRMRAAWRVFGDYFRPKAVAPYLKGLKRTGRALGRVRDLDVLMKKIRIYLDSLPVEQQASLDGLLVALQAQRELARARMIEYLDSDKYARFKETFAEFVETEGMGSRAITSDEGEPRPYRVRHIAPVIIYERLAVMRAYDEWLGEADPSLARYHQLRIACKRLRYTLEFFREVLGPDTKAAIKEVVAMQDHLGALQDAVVARDVLRDFLRQRTEGGDDDPANDDRAAWRSDPGAVAYLGVQQAEIEHLLDTFPEAWQVLRGPEFSQMVSEVVAVL